MLGVFNRNGAFGGFRVTAGNRALVRFLKKVTSDSGHLSVGPAQKEGFVRHRVIERLASQKVRQATSESGRLGVSEVEQFGCVRVYDPLRVGVFPLTGSNPYATRAAQLKQGYKGVSYSRSVSYCVHYQPLRVLGAGP